MKEKARLALLARRLLLWAVLWLQVEAETTPSSTGWTSPIWNEEVKTMEESVVGSILQIVDRKFDTLSERLSSMERALNGLQFYQVRQFRGAQGSLQSISSSLQAVSTQVTQLSTDTQATKVAIGDLEQQVKVGQMAHSDRADDLERAVLYINQNLNQKAESLTEYIKQRTDDVARLVGERADDVNNNVIKRAQEVSDKLIEVAEVVNKNVDEESEDVRIAVELAVLTMNKDTSTSRLTTSIPTPQPLVYGPQPRDVSSPLCDLDIPTLEVTLDTRFEAFTRHSDARLAVRFRDMTDRVDMLFRSRFDEFAEFADRHVEKLSNRTQCAVLQGDLPGSSEAASAGEAPPQMEETTMSSPTRFIASTEATTAAPGRSAAPLTRSPGGNIPGDDGGMFKGLLSNLTVNVIQAVSFFRHTGEMMERILSNSETLAEEQARIRRALTTRASSSLPFPQYQSQHFLQVEGSQGHSDLHSPTQPTSSFDSQDSFSNHIPNGPDSQGVSEAVGRVSTQSGQGEPSSRPCSDLTPDLIEQVSKIVSNGTQMVELVTELVQLTSITLTSTVEDLKQELDKLKEARARVIDVIIPAVNRALGRDDLSRDPGSVDEDHKESLGTARTEGESVLMRTVVNTTKAIFQIAEAIASNTGWIPYIFHNVQFVEGQVNKSILLGQRLASDLLTLPEKFSAATLRNAPCQSEGTGTGEGGGLNKEEWTWLRSVHATALKLERIMPALTRLIAEPEPLITLVGGQQPTEGRVEIYYRGQWGTLCDVTMGHVEADMLCRQLGYFGGIAAGSGIFGAGSGLLWHFNKTCVQNFKCPLVSRDETPQACSHETDFAVVCDHMIRLEALSGSNDVSTGRVQMYHQGSWRGVCGAGWGINEARVTCRQLGYQTGRPISGGRDTANPFVAFVKHPKCEGDENSLHMCQWEEGQILGRCAARRHAAVTCQ